MTAVLLDVDDPHRDRPAHQRLDGLDGRRVDLLEPGGSHQGEPGVPQGALAGDDALLLADEARHARDHEQEQHHRCAGDDEHLGSTVGLDDPDCGRDEAGDGEQREPHAREPRAPVGRGLLERPHRGVKRRGAPQEVVRDPAHVQQDLVVVRALEQHVVVDGVRDEQTHDARGEQEERRLAAAGVDREPDRRGEQQHVAQRVGHRHTLGEVGHAAEVDVRRDQEDPRQQADAERQDQRVDQAGAVGDRVSAPDEQHEAGHQRRVHRQVERVAGRRERHIRAVRVDVAQEEQELPDQEEHPCLPEPRLVKGDAEHDRHRGREPERIHHPAVAGNGRHHRVEQGDEGAQRHVPAPGALPRDPGRVDRARDGHAASRAASERSRSLPAAASSAMTLVRRSISASVLAAVTWTRNPTSCFGTSGYAASVT